MPSNNPDAAWTIREKTHNVMELKGRGSTKGLKRGWRVSQRPDNRRHCQLATTVLFSLIGKELQRTLPKNFMQWCSVVKLQTVKLFLDVVSQIVQKNNINPKEVIKSQSRERWY